MKSKYSLLTPLLMALFICCCLWIVTDVAYGVRVWEADLLSWMNRLKALAVITFFTFSACIFFRYTATFFFGKNKTHIRAFRILEYASILVFILFVLNLALYIIITCINHSGYRWGEAYMINAVAIPLFLLYYTSIRNHILFTKYTEKIIQLEKIKVYQLENELKLLKAQYHPHFLFNALNTLYFQIDEENSEAIETIDLLSGLLRYQLYDIDKEVSIGQEMDYLQNYMRLQKLRMTERLQLSCFIDPALKSQSIHSLLFQPLLENAFKYIGGAYELSVSIRLEENKVHFSVMNSTDTADVSNANISKKKRNGIGIENLRRRLGLLYPGKHTLNIRQDALRYTADLTIKLSE